VEAHPVTHPSAAALEALARGRLSAASFEVVLGHLDSCAACRKEVAALSDDGFLDRLRAAQSHSGTPAPHKSVSGLSRSLNASGPTQSHLPGPISVPPELTGHSQYQIVRELGRGGMGVVYLVRNRLMDRPEVLKVMNRALLDRPGAAERFLREIRAAGRLSHANVVTAYNALDLDGLLVLAMEYVAGTDLARLVKADGPLPVGQACTCVRQVALALQHAHELGLVHRDIKPGNLILSRRGQRHVVKVLDFGLAKVLREKELDGGLTANGILLGTPDYIAPEQTRDPANADIRADVYSLGCTLYFLLAGRPPFQGGSVFEVLEGHRTRDAEPLNRLRPDVPLSLAAVVAKMKAKDPARRYQTPVEVARAVAPFTEPRADAASRSANHGEADPGGGRFTEAKKRDALAAAVPSVLPGRSLPPEVGLAVPAAKKRRVVVWGAVCLVLLGVVGLLGLWAGGVFKAKTTATPEGTPPPARAGGPPPAAPMNVRWQETLSLQGNRHTLHSVCLSGDGKRIVAGTMAQDGRPEIKVWDALSGKELLTLKGHTAAVRSVCVSGDGMRIVSSSEDRTFKVWDAQTEQVLHTIKGECVDVSGDGKRIVSVTDGSTKVWDAQTGQVLRTIKGQCVCVSGDGKCIVTGQRAGTSNDNGKPVFSSEIKGWEAETGQELLTFKFKQLNIVSTSVCVSGDGKRIVSSGYDGVTRVWNATTK
jgi:serine/threonine protein kinase/WD40 repeat protein